MVGLQGLHQILTLLRVGSTEGYWEIPYYGFEGNGACRGSEEVMA